MHHLTKTENAKYSNYRSIRFYGSKMAIHWKISLEAEAS